MLVLASASPRRKALLEQAGLRFLVDPADVDEGLEPSVSPSQAARLLAERKARAVHARGTHPGAWIVGSDTIVALGDETLGWSLLGKPTDPAEARRMLESLSRTRHRVITGVAVLRAQDAALESAIETTWVTMREIRPQEIEDYVASEEWRDKAGGYAIQENADAFVTQLEGGGFDNVVGLPVALTLQLLGRLGAPGLPIQDS